MALRAMFFLEMSHGSLISARGSITLPNLRRGHGAAGNPFGHFMRKGTQMKHVWIASLLLAALGWTAGIGRAADATPAKDSPQPTTQSTSQSTAPKTAASADTGKTKLKGRLPAYYSKLVDTDQKQKIYEIDANFDPKIKDLKKQMEALIAQRDEQIKAVLTPEQQSKLADLIAEAKAKRKEKRAHAVDAKTTASPKPANSSANKPSDQPAVTGPVPVPETKAPAPPAPK